MWIAGKAVSSLSRLAQKMKSITGLSTINLTIPFDWTLFENPMIEDQKLSENFTLYELTNSSHLDLLERNRIVSEEQISKLKEVATMLEICRLILEVPLRVSSGYRCPDLNRAVGSTEKSQHLLCEAADFVPKGIDLSIAFKQLRQACKEGKLPFGQLIFEKAERNYNTVEWLHISLSQPYRPVEKCGQVLTNLDGQFHLIETIVPQIV